MPQIIKIGSYIVHSWSKENDPLEPVHVHKQKVLRCGDAAKCIDIDPCTMYETARIVEDPLMYA